MAATTAPARPPHYRWNYSMFVVEEACSWLGLTFASVKLPSQRRETRIVKDLGAGEIAREIADWIAEK